MDIIKPNRPTIAMPPIIKPVGTPADPMPVVEVVYVGITNGGGAVYVGRRVGWISTTNCEARVGSMVGVTRGVGVGGGATTGNVPLTAIR